MPLYDGTLFFFLPFIVRVYFFFSDHSLIICQKNSLELWVSFKKKIQLLTSCCAQQFFSRFFFPSFPTKNACRVEFRVTGTPGLSQVEPIIIILSLVKKKILIPHIHCMRRFTHQCESGARQWRVRSVCRRSGDDRRLMLDVLSSLLKILSPGSSHVRLLKMHRRVSLFFLKNITFRWKNHSGFLACHTSSSNEATYNFVGGAARVEEFPSHIILRGHSTFFFSPSFDRHFFFSPGMPRRISANFPELPKHTPNSI